MGLGGVGVARWFYLIVFGLCVGNLAGFKGFGGGG